MNRRTRKCPNCNSDISVSNYERHLVAERCISQMYPWHEYKIAGDLFRCPDGFTGTKRSCSNHLNALISFKEGRCGILVHHRKLRTGEATPHNKGNKLPLKQCKKISDSLIRFNKTVVRQPPSNATRAKMSASRKQMLLDHPENHPNRLLAGNRAKMSYPESVAAGWLMSNGIAFDHNKKIGQFFPDFTIGNVIIEIDGERWHSSPEQKEKDRIRDIFLTNLGFNVIRIASKERIEEKLATIFRSDGSWVAPGFGSRFA